ncbi:hypothetical protein J7J90_03560 [Candidatus Micrarchaeota archaeon]|nr:hypothetical protein [Candidatus Micrarchaeota archaeon]
MLVASIIFVVALMIYLSYTVIEHYWGNMTKNPQLIAMAKVRLHTAIMNSLLFGFILLFIMIFMGVRGVSPGLISFMINPSSPPVIEDYVYNYLSSLIFHQVPLLLNTLIGLLGLVQSLKSIVSFAVGSVITGAILDFTLYDRLINYMIMFISPLLGSLYVQLLVIMTIMSFYPYLISSGLILRFFDLTRRAGSFMVALGLSSYVIFISMYALNGYIMTNIISSGVIYNQIKDISDTSILSVVNVWGTPGDLMYLVLNFIPGLNKLFHLYFYMFYKVLVWFTIIGFQGVVIPTFSIIVTTTSINAFTKWFESFV